MIAAFCAFSSFASPVALPFESAVIEADGSPVAAFAVRELNEIVSRTAGGRRFEVAKDAERAKGLTKIVVRRDDAYADEESAVFEKDGDLHLVGGGELGCLWAVYDFVEDSLGYRWILYRPDGERIVKTDVVRWNGRSSRRRPKFRGIRRLWNGARDWEVRFRVRNRDAGVLNSLVPEYRHRYQLWTKGHGFEMYLPAGEITPAMRWGIPKGAKIEPNNFKRHPEWYSLMADGTRNPDHQLCLSNPGCRKALIEAISEYVRVCGRGVYMVGENDARFGRYCFCDGCRALERKYNTTGGPMWDFIIEACHEVKKRFGEGVYLQTLAYNGMNQTEKAPDGIEKFPDNFIVDVAYIHCPDRSIHELPDVRAPEGEMVNYWQNTLKWAKLTDHTSYWFYGTASPFMVYRRMTDEIRELAEAGWETVGACGTGSSYEFNDITKYLFYRLCLDPFCDVRGELEAACAFKYGKAAPLMLAYVDSLENRFIEVRAKSPGSIFETDHPYRNLSFIRGRDLVEWRRIFEKAEPLVADSPFHAANVRYSKLLVDLFSVVYAKRIADECPGCVYDVRAAEAACRATAKEYGERFLRPGSRNEALDLLEQSANEMAYFGNLKSEALPKAFDGIQPAFVTRILPYLRKPMRRPQGGDSEKHTSDPDPQAVCGYTVTDRLGDDHDFSKGIPVYLWDWGAKRQLLAGRRIPLSVLKKDEYALCKIGETVIPADSSLIIDERWSSPFAQRFFNRCHQPAHPGRRYEIWLSVKAQGPKFFPDDSRENRLFIEQLFVVEIVGSGE